MEMNENLRCAIFGQRTMRFKWGFDEDEEQCRRMKLGLLQQIAGLRQQGVTQFFVACDHGIGLYAAEQINHLRETDSDLMLFCTTPHEGQATKWAPYLRERYFRMLEDCTYLDCIDLAEQPDAQLKAYKKIIDRTDMILTVFDLSTPAEGCAEDVALVYALGCQKPIINLDPYTLDAEHLSIVSQEELP